MSDWINNSMQKREKDKKDQKQAEKKQRKRDMKFGNDNLPHVKKMVREIGQAWIESGERGILGRNKNHFRIRVKKATLHEPASVRLDFWTGEKPIDFVYGGLAVTLRNGKFQATGTEGDYTDLESLKTAIAQAWEAGKITPSEYGKQAYDD